MIRQAISCDICGTEKKQTNHWFVATEHGSELHVSGWNSRKRLRAESKHLCGQICLHKLLDEFVARSIAAQHAPSADASLDTDAKPAASATPSPTSFRTDASLTSASPVRRVPPLLTDLDRPAENPMPAAVAKPMIVSPAVVPLPIRATGSVPAPPPPPVYTPTHSRAEAWERERERTQVRNGVSCPHKRF